MGFDVNVLDEFGVPALAQIFKASCQSSKLSTIIDKFLQRGRHTDFDARLLLEHLGKSFSLSGHAAFGTCVLLRLG